jgi:hypothetical protein
MFILNEYSQESFSDINIINYRVLWQQTMKKKKATNY